MAAHVKAFTPTGAFCFYASWNLVGLMLVLFFMPETKDKTLEELDSVFSLPLRTHARYGLAQLRWFLGSYVLCRTVDKPQVPRYELLLTDEKTTVTSKPDNPTDRV